MQSGGQSLIRIILYKRLLIGTLINCKKMFNQILAAKSIEIGLWPFFFWLNSSKSIYVYTLVWWTLSCGAALTLSSYLCMLGSNYYKTYYVTMHINLV